MIRHALTRPLILAAMLAAVSLAAAPASAEPGPRGRDQRRAFSAYRAALARVGLSDEQKLAIEAIAERSREQVRLLRAAHLADRAQLEVLLAAEPPDPTAIGGAVLRLEGHRERMKAHRRAVHEATVAVLTHDQRIAFESALDTLRAVARHRPRPPR